MFQKCFRTTMHGPYVQTSKFSVFFIIFFPWSTMVQKVCRLENSIATLTALEHYICQVVWNQRMEVLAHIRRVCWGQTFLLQTNLDKAVKLSTKIGNSGWPKRSDCSAPEIFPKKDTIKFSLKKNPLAIVHIHSFQNWNIQPQYVPKQPSVIFRLLLATGLNGKKSGKGHQSYWFALSEHWKTVISHIFFWHFQAIW